MSFSNLHRSYKKSNLNFFTLVLSFLLVSHLVLLVFFNREIFFTSYNVEYWKERFEHSQWQIPLSTRSIGDDALFSYIGYEMVNGLDPVSINAETPPLGKYIIGASIHLFKNSIIISFISYLLIIGLLIYFYKIYLKNNNEALLLTLIVVLNPIIYQQGYTALLDNFQLLFLLFSLIFIHKLKDNKSKSNLFLAGAGLGLAFGIKFPLIFPIFLLFESYIIFWYLKIRKGYLIYLFSFFTFLLIPYIRFFQLGNGVFDLIRLQKFILSFYTASRLQIQEGAVFVALLIGKIPEFVDQKLINVDEWIIVWPVIFILFMGFLVRIIQGEHRKYLVGLYLSVIISIIVYSFVPFFPRYLVVLLPFIYLFSYLTIRNSKYRLVIFFVILIVSFVYSVQYLRPSPSTAINNLIFQIENSNYNDLYETQLAKPKPLTDRHEFHRTVMIYLDDSSIEKISPKLISIEKVNGNEIEAKFDYEYYSNYLGTFSEEKLVRFVKINSIWRPVWSWDLIVNDLNLGDKLILEKEDGYRGAIYDKNGKVIVSDDVGYLFSVNPNEYDSSREEELINFLGSFINIEPVNIQNGYLDDPSLGFVDVGTNYRVLSEKEFIKLNSFKGVRAEEHIARINYQIDPSSLRSAIVNDCCKNIYSPGMVIGVAGLEKEYENTLRGADGGRIVIVDEYGDLVRIVHEKDKLIGKDVYLEL